MVVTFLDIYHNVCTGKTLLQWRPSIYFVDPCECKSDFSELYVKDQLKNMFVSIGNHFRLVIKYCV